MKMKDLIEMSSALPADSGIDVCKLNITPEQKRSLFEDPDFLLLFRQNSSIKDGVIKFLHFELTCAA